MHEKKETQRIEQPVGDKANKLSDGDDFQQSNLNTRRKFTNEEIQTFLSAIIEKGEEMEPEEEEFLIAYFNACDRMRQRLGLDDSSREDKIWARIQAGTKELKEGKQPKADD